MKIESYSRNAIDILALRGRFDAHTLDDVHQWLILKTAVDNPQLIINLNGVNFIDSAGLALLVCGLKWCRQREGKLHLCHIQQPVHIIFELTRLDKAFEIFDNEESAVKGFPVPMA